MPMDGVGLMHARTMSGMPLVMPPRMPPLLLVSVLTTRFPHKTGRLPCEPRRAAKAKACAELHALDSGHAEQDGGQAALHAVEHRAADTGGEADGCALDDAADRILLLARFLDSGQHGLERTRIVDRVFGVPQRIQLLGGDSTSSNGIS